MVYVILAGRGDELYGRPGRQIPRDNKKGGKMNTQNDLLRSTSIKL